MIDRCGFLTLVSRWDTNFLVAPNPAQIATWYEEDPHFQSPSRIYLFRTNLLSFMRICIQSHQIHSSLSMQMPRRVCPRDIYSHTVRDMDRRIVALIHDRKKTQSTTPRLGPAVPAGSHLKHDTGNHLGTWRPVRCQAWLGWHGSVPADGNGRRKQEQGGRAVPVHRVAVCCLGGKIDGGAVVQAPVGDEGNYSDAPKFACN